jgi:N6-L-threonylcarbamoyladenine synthase
MAVPLYHGAMTLTVLGLETSCDETAAAVVRGRPGAVPAILSNVVRAQLAEHRAFGGVVPEIAARAHVEALDGVVARAMADAKLSFDALDGVAATAGPGLIGGLIVGVTMGKAIALARNRPFLAINHLEAHALSPRLMEALSFPYLLLLISGGHCQLLAVEGVARYRRYGTTVDDAVGEAFDKTAKLLGLGYPGGPAVEQAAKSGDASRFAFPRPMQGREDCHFSFSGLKTAVARMAEKRAPLSVQDKRDLAASFQAAIADVLADRTTRAMARFAHEHTHAARSLVVAGGVAANAFLRARLTRVSQEWGYRLIVPPPALCTDNGAMVAWAGLERLSLGLVDGLDARPRPRWPLDPAAPPALGAGVKA